MRRRRSIREQARRIKRYLRALTIAMTDARTPFLARALAVFIIAYAASPIDLIPDFIPVLGYLDDVILLPLGILLVIRLIPQPVWISALRRAVRGEVERRPWLRVVGATLVTALWAAVVYAVVRAIVRATWG